MTSKSSVESIQKVRTVITDLSKKLYNILKSLVLLNPSDKVSRNNFELLKLLGTGAYGKVYLVKKKDGKDAGKLYAMKVLEKTKVTAKLKTTEHTKTEREVRKLKTLCQSLTTILRPCFRFSRG